MSSLDRFDSIDADAPAKSEDAGGGSLARFDAIASDQGSPVVVNVSGTSTSKSPGAQQGDRIASNFKQAANDVRNGNIGGIPGVGAGEAAINMASGIGSSAVGGLAGLARTGYGLVTGQGVDASIQSGANTSQAIQSAGTYQPRTAAGNLLSEVASVPLNVAKAGLSSVGGDVGQVFNGAQGRVAGEAIGDAAPDVAATLMGGRAALNAVRPGVPINDITQPYDRIEPTLPQKPRYTMQNGKPVLAGPAEAPPSIPTQSTAPAAAADYSQAESLAPTGDAGTKGSLLPLQDQSARAAVLRRIGLSDTRTSALKGDAMTGATQAQMANFNEPAGIAAKDLFDSERSALQNHAQNIVRDTGGTIGTDERTLNVRGQTIAAPFDGLRAYFNDATKSLYKAADEKAGGMPSTDLSDFGSLINTESQFAGKAANGSLGSGIRSYLREQNIMGKDGNMSPVTAQQAEGIKQYINSQWSPETSGLAGKIKGAIDNDVFKGAGDDVYAQARNMYKLQKQTLDNPNGVSKLMDFDPQTPINRATPYNKLPDALTNLSPDQFKHVVDTLKGMPEQLQPQAQAAISEIKAQMANSLADTGSKYAGQWNAKGVTQELKNNTAKYPMVFDPSELAKISDLNNAGHILSVNKSYPGAAAQAANAMKQGMMPHLVGGLTTAAGATAGSILGAPGAAAGGFIGRVAGNKAAAAIGEGAALKKFNKGVVKLSEFP